MTETPSDPDEANERAVGSHERARRMHEVVARLKEQLADFQREHDRPERARHPEEWASAERGRAAREAAARESESHEADHDTSTSHGRP